MDSLADRLQLVMQHMNWERADLVRVSRQSSSVVSQWLGRGSKEIKTIGKLEAAIYLERASGFSSLWIAKGMGPRFAQGQHPRSIEVNEPTPDYSDSATLERLGQLLARVPVERRQAVADALSGWAREGGADHWRSMLLAAIAPPGKPPARAHG